MIFFRKTIAGIALALMAVPAAAATFNFDVRVVTNNDTGVFSPQFDLPDIGTTGTIEFTLDAATLDADGDPQTGVNVDQFPLSQSLADASANFPGANGLSTSLTV